MLGRLESRGLIRRAPSEEGGKRNQIILTQAGADMARALRQLMPREADKVFAGLTEDELQVADRIFRTICANLKSSR
jgi:DNA-binding MarR family transcriptional regulator